MIKRLLLRAYRAMPQPVRRGLAEFGPLASLRRRYFERDSSLHDEYYTQAYYEEDCGPTRQSAPAMSRAMLGYLRPADVLDVGCGTGEYLEAFRDAGIPARGVELATAALEQCRAKGLEVAQVDLSKGQPLPWTADLVFSFEVAEHIPEPAAAGFVGMLTSAARKHICLTAAAPGQDGLCHFNCQPKSYWIRHFTDRGFTFDRELTERWERENAEAGLAPWLCNNLMIFHAPGEG